MNEIVTATPPDETDEIMEQMDLALQGEKLYIDYTTDAAGAKDDRYTGVRFLREYPERGELVAKLAALGFSNRAIGRKVHCDPRIVRELRFRCVKEISQQREILRETVFPAWRSRRNGLLNYYQARNRLRTRRLHMGFCGIATCSFRDCRLQRLKWITSSISAGNCES